ncbi:lipoyl(octanoyl) transferase LipB [Methylobacillus arboreus]|uniref:lipoyl(octanoyl) transferase LipB n=1 Tax=Methylobacillus arboreus TaxID=755170 RepID=UPI001E30F2E2|nr:lipoyl(octanoyl) transferase LipB [Methylobacillus arboreus]MCB5190714.1 lipoyl(octanoyl) transferase LipB [Methylobacillus arboreus]
MHPERTNQRLVIRTLGRTDYLPTWQAMRVYTQSRTEHSADELWLTEHAPVYTLGLNRKEVRPPSRSDIPLIEVDRGGKITYHGPGQAVIYVLIDLKRRGISVRSLVSAMENAIIALLADSGIHAEARTDAPGVYVHSAKIASLGLRLKNQRSYHGLALNIDMDLAPFLAIDPCGYRGLQVTQVRDLVIGLTPETAAQKLLDKLTSQLGYTDCLTENTL